MFKFLAFVIGIGLGAAGMYMYYPKIHKAVSTPLVEMTDAKVKSIDGVFIYIEAEPKADYNEIGELSQDNVVETLQNLSGIAQDEEKNMVEKLLDSANEIRENISFDQRLKAYVKAAKQKSDKVEGLVFRHAGLEEATMIAFNH